MGTITSTITQTVTLGTVDNYPTYSSPLTIAASGAVDVNATVAIYGPPTQAWTVTNYGDVINSNASAGAGITLGLGGLVVNGSGRTIRGYTGIAIGGSPGSSIPARSSAPAHSADP